MWPVSGRRTYSLQTDGRGRLLLPRELREATGIGPNAEVRLSVTDDGTVTLSNPVAARRAAIRAARGAYAGRGMSADELIAERRAEAAREDA